MSDSDNYNDFMEAELHESGKIKIESDDAPELPAHEKPIPSNNFGYKLLQKMGWKEGKGLGSQGQGRSEPIPFITQEDKVGVGKDNELNLYHSISTAERKLLEAEVIASETDEQRLARKEKNDKKLEVQKEITTALSVFYCALCDKQYTKSSDYETHLDSYDHHHKKRFKEMGESTRKLYSKKPKKATTENVLKELSAEQGVSLISSETASVGVSSGWATIPETASVGVSSGWATIPEPSWANVEPTSSNESPQKSFGSSQPTSATTKLSFTSKEKAFGSTGAKPFKFVFKKK